MSPQFQQWLPIEVVLAIAWFALRTVLSETSFGWLKDPVAWGFGVIALLLLGQAISDAARMGAFDQVWWGLGVLGLALFMIFGGRRS